MVYGSERTQVIISLENKYIYKSRVAGCHQELGERHGVYTPPEPPEGTNPVHTLSSDFQPPEL